MSRARSRRDTKKANQPTAAKEWANTPFRVLKQIVAKAPPVTVPLKPKPTGPQGPVASPPQNDEDLFQRAVSGVKPLLPGERGRVDQAAPASPAREITSADAEALAELCDLVSGDAPFDLTCIDEHIEGTVVGLDPRVLRQLRNGEFAYQAYLDLHRMTTDEARPAVEKFLMQAFQGGKRCVLIVHGRGRNSKDQIPVLKQRLATWLARGRWSHWVLGFTSARACDGGVGALYVLLRRQRHAKQAIRVTHGAKW